MFHVTKFAISIALFSLHLSSLFTSFLISIKSCPFPPSSKVPPWSCSTVYAQLLCLSGSIRVLPLSYSLDLVASVYEFESDLPASSPLNWGLTGVVPCVVGLFAYLL